MSATIQSFPPCSEKILNSKMNVGNETARTTKSTKVNDETLMT